MIKNIIYYILSFTWGIIMSLIGLITAGVLIILGNKPIKLGPTIRFEIGENWGGITLGCVVITYKEPSSYIVKHEFGHTLQNCVFGPAMVFIGLASLIRATYRTIKKIDKGYYDIWFEQQASDWGIYISRKYFSTK